MKKLKVHFLGIGGSGASAVAAIAKANGYEITGCDKNPFNDYTKVFDRESLQVGHSLAHLKDVDILAVTPAIFALDPDNEELLEAKKRGIRIMTWQEFMGEYLEEDKFVIAICGTHGKTTTTALVGLMLEEAGFDPTVEVGSVIKKWETNYRIGKSKYFVTEADEFNDNFLASKPDMAIVTSIEFDHPEYFKDFEVYKKSFIKFLSSVKQTIIANISDPAVSEVMKVVMKENGVSCIDYSKSDFHLNLKVPGKHNLLNASAVFHLGLVLGINPEIIRNSVEGYPGSGRRFEYLGEKEGVKVYSDYAHHPTALKVTLEAARDKFKDKNILAIFQPHMFTRTKALFNEFVEVLRSNPVQKIYILDIFPSRERDLGIVSSKQLVDEVGDKKVEYIKSEEELNQKIEEKIKDYDLILYMGAGSIDDFAKRFVSKN